MTMIITKDNGIYKPNYMLSIKDKILINLCNEQKIIHFIDIMKSNSFERIYRWNKGKIDIEIDENMEEHKKEQQ